MSKLDYGEILTYIADLVEAKKKNLKGYFNHVGNEEFVFSLNEKFPFFVYNAFYLRKIMDEVNGDAEDILLGRISVEKTKDNNNRFSKSLKLVLRKAEN